MKIHSSTFTYRSYRVLTLCAAVFGVSSQLAVAGTMVVWEDSSPLTSPSMIGGMLIVNTVDASSITNDPTRNAVGEVVFSGVNKFSNISRPPVPVTLAMFGQTATLSVDYFVPLDTTLDDNGSPDLFWLQMNINGVNRQDDNTAGFIGESFAGAGWRTLTLDYNIPPDATDLRPLIVVADGGFGSGTPNGTGEGTAFYIDNIKLEVGVVPEPPSILAALTSLAVCWGLCVRLRSTRIVQS